MPQQPPLAGADFYDRFPLENHRTGDIWRDLPTFGMLDRETTWGIVITPACDLENRKCETISYLPIISVADYLCSAAFRQECWSEIVSLLNKLPNFGAVFPPTRYELVSLAELDALAQDGVDARGKTLAEGDVSRLTGYRDYVASSSAGQPTLEQIKRFFKHERLQTLLEKVITNSLKPDIHFLPSQSEKSDDFSLTKHSVVLFRYPLTLPIQALDLAHQTMENQWMAQRNQKAGRIPSLRHMSVWPLKIAALRGEFLSDMVSRYIGIHVRLGSTDFSEQTVGTIADQIRE